MGRFTVTTAPSRVATAHARSPAPGSAHPSVGGLGVPPGSGIDVMVACPSGRRTRSRVAHVTCSIARPSRDAEKRRHAAGVHVITLTALENGRPGTAYATSAALPGPLPTPRGASV